ncbi:uncharacterized protein LOC121964549, partial [Plectropomus leopardus]|uniref:uncharacterized protein LOC121964549 n=1 Tax=Plectropomus leopardus TaxID=160734 RepID=UPI001C4C7C04
MIDFGTGVSDQASLSQSSSWCETAGGRSEQQESCFRDRSDQGGTRSPKSTKLQNFRSAVRDRYKTHLKREVTADIVTMADEAAVVEEVTRPAQSPLITVSFQRSAHRKEKYLEAEPKALGITQIGLSIFKITCTAVFLITGLGHVFMDVMFFIASAL